MDKTDLLDLINDDDLGLLDIEKKSVSATPDDRLSESFMEINEFFSLHNAEPKSGGDIHEHKLASRLKHIRENREQRDYLSQYDTHGLLKIEKKGFDTVDDIFVDDDLDLLSFEDESIFNITNIEKSYRKKAELIARRKAFKDFFKYEELFVNCQNSIKAGVSKLQSFKHGDITQGKFFVLNGVLLLVDSIVMDSEKDSYGKEDGRLHCIFENGTESRMKFRSLQKALEISGKTVVNLNKVVAPDDEETGYIYVLKSLSDNPRIANTKNLFKIGFSTTSVEERIKNADQDPTYLMAPVSIIATYRCFNMNPQRFERLIHRFFIESCLDIEITDNKGKKYVPKEWFIAPITVIEKAIELIINGEIVNYSYDHITQSIIRKEKAL
jgi:hypothetical protein